MLQCAAARSPTACRGSHAMQRTFLPQPCRCAGDARKLNRMDCASCMWYGGWCCALLHTREAVSVRAGHCRCCVHRMAEW